MVKWTSHAKRHLRHIHDYIKEDSPLYAKRVSKAITQKTLVLNDFPKLGRVVPEFNVETIREIPIYSYRIIYEIKPTHIDILSVIHKRQELLSEDFPGIQ